MRKTRKNKGDFVKHQTRKQTQVGGQTNPKRNYTFYYAGYDPFGRFESFSCPDATRLGCPGEPGRASVAWITDGICDSYNNLYMCSSYTGGIFKVNNDGYTSIFNPDSFPHGLGLTFGRNNTWPMYVFASVNNSYKIGRLLENGTADTQYNNLGVKTISDTVSGVCCDNNNRLYYTAGSHIYRMNLPTDLVGSHVKLTQETTGDLDGTITTARVSTLGQCRYHSQTNSIFFNDIGNNKIKKLDLSANQITTVSWKWQTPQPAAGPAKITSLEEPADKCFFSISPTTNTLYYIKPDSNTSSHGIYTLNINTGVSKRYSGGGTAQGGKTLYNTLLDFGTAVKESTVYTENSSFTGTAIHPENPTFLVVDYNENIFCTKSEGGYGSRIYVTSPTAAAVAPTSIMLNAATPNSLTIGWSDDTQASSYEVTISPSATIPLVPGTATSATFTGLVECTSYTITIKAKNRRGVAQPKIITCMTTIDTTNFVLLPAFSSSVSLLNNTPSIISCLVSWTGISRAQQITYTLTPVSSGTSGSTGATGATGPPISGIIPSNANPYAITELEPNTTYSLTITGSLLNVPTIPVTGNSIYSVTSNSVAFTTKPVLPLYMGTLVGSKSNSSPSGPLRNTSLKLNRGIVQDNAKNIYISSETCIYKLSPSASTTYYVFDTSQVHPTPLPITNPHVGLSASSISLFAGSSTAGSPSTSQTGSSIRFGNIVGMTYYGDALYVTDSMYNVVVKITIPSTGAPTSTIVAGKVTASGAVATSGPRDGAIGSNSLSNPRDIIRGIDNNLYIADYNNSCIRLLNPTTNVISTLLRSVPGAASGSQSKTPIYISNPSSLVQLPDGSFYVACTGDHTIRKLTPFPLNPGTYSVSLFAGTPNSSGNTDGPNLSAKFTSPNGLVLDSANNLYIYDSGNSSIRIIIGQIVYTYLGGASGNTDGPASSAKFTGDSGESSLTKLFFDVNNNLYLSDTGNGSLRAVTNYPVDQVITDTQLTNYRASAAQASSAVAQTASSAIAQVASSALAQAISGAQESSAVAQVASSALAQVASSAVAQVASSALAQSISGAQESSAVAQVASSALAQAVSGARESSAVAQVASSALAQSISGAQQSSAVAQNASSALAQVASSALAQSISGAQQSSAVAQNASSAVAQSVSSALEQTASSAIQLQALVQPLSVKDEILQRIKDLQDKLKENRDLLYSPESSQSTKNIAIEDFNYYMDEMKTARDRLDAISEKIFSIAPKYQDRNLQRRVSAPYIESMGFIKLYDLMRKGYVVIDSNGYLVPNIESPYKRDTQLLTTPALQSPSVSVAMPEISYSGSMSSTPSLTTPQAGGASSSTSSGASRAFGSSGALSSGASRPFGSSGTLSFGASRPLGASGTLTSGILPTDLLVSSDTTVPASSPWRSYFDPVRRLYLYMNTTTNSSQFEHPFPPVFSGSDDIIIDTTTKFLPNGWIKLKNSSINTPYYFNVISTETSWIHPNLPPDSSTLSPVTDATLNPPYKKYLDPATNRLFYVNTLTRESQWNFPDESFNTGPSTAQQASSAVAQAVSGAQESSAVAQVASSALAQAISGARESSAVAQVASSALAQSISGAQESSAVAQAASSAFERRSVSSADAQVASSALAQAISGAQASSAVAQVASSAVAQAISGARESSAVAQVASSALAQSISGAQESSAVAQVASSAFERRSVSSADAQVASSALAQAISGAQASSAVAQVASSAVAQAVSGAQASSAVAQVASSALAQAISGAQESSAVAQVASSAFERRSVSSADAQVASSALAQAISGAQASSADAQYTSSARASSAVAQVASQAVASSAQAEAALSGLLEQKDTIKADLNASKNPILEMINTVYSTSGGATTESVTQLQSMIAALMDKQNQLKTTATNIFRFRDYYQDTALQTVVPEPNLRVSGAKKVYDSLRNRYIVVDSNGTIIPNPATPATRSYTTFTMRGGDSVPA